MTDDVTRVLDEWLPTGQATRLTGRKEAYLRHLRAAGRLRFLWDGGRVRYYRADLEALGPRTRRGRPRKETDDRNTD